MKWLKELLDYVSGKVLTHQVINTAFIIILDTKSGIYYLQADSNWMQATQVSGPWSLAQAVPSTIQNLEVNKKDYSQKATTTTLPNIIISTKPAALIQVNGKTEFSPIQGTSLMVVSNSDNNIFYQIKTQEYFVLLSGRWYKSNDLTSNASWTNVDASTLPSDFAKIPSDSKNGNALASIPSTPAAQAAIIQNQIPQTAKVKRDSATVSVAYDGDPQFKSIPGTSMQYAINTDNSVISLNNMYYVCYQGVWFLSNSPNGPWTVATAIPDDIYTIPPSVPIYPVTYTYIYNSTPDYVYLGYTNGYLNSYLYNGAILYGTGYDYHPWIGHVYYGFPITFGFNFVYSHAVWAANVSYDSMRWYGGGLNIGHNAYGPAGWHVGWFGAASGAVFANHYSSHHTNINNINVNKVNNFNSHNVYNRWNNKVVVNNHNQQIGKNFNQNHPNAKNKAGQIKNSKITNNPTVINKANKFQKNGNNTPSDLKAKAKQHGNKNNVGNNLSPEHKEKAKQHGNKNNVGNNLSPEHKEKAKQHGNKNNVGNNLSPEHKEKVKQHGNKNYQGNNNKPVKNANGQQKSHQHNVEHTAPHNNMRNQRNDFQQHTPSRPMGGGHPHGRH